MLKPDSGKGKRAISYDSIARFYDGLTSVIEWFISKQRKEILRHSNGVVLEVGAGTGNSFRNYPPANKVIAVDVSEGMLQLAKKKLETCHCKIELLLADAQKLPFRDETFDTIFVSLVFCSVAKPIKGLKELRRVLKKGGLLLMIEHVKSTNRVLGYLMEKLNPSIARFDNINRETVKHVKEAGFAVRRERNIAYDVLKAIVASR